MSDDPVRVSVVLPFLDAERFLAESVESVLAQTYPHWELLLVDDGSADGSAAMAGEYARRHPGRVRHLAHPGRENRGISASRNLGVRESRGEFLALLDADDVWLPDKLARHVPLLEAHPEAGMLYGDTLYWYSWTGNAADLGRDHCPPLGVPRGAVVDGRALLLRQLAGDAESPCTCSVLSRRAVVERVGGFEDAFRGMHEDQVFYAKMLLEAPAFVAHGCLERYRRYLGESGSVTAAHAEPRALAAARLAYLDWLAGHLEARGLAGGDLWRIVDDARRALRRPRAHAWRAFARRGARAVARALGVGTPRPGAVRFGHLRRTRPINRHWGWERGQPVDRHYIEGFLARHAADVRGRVLEVGDDAYTRRFGGDRVTRRDVLHVHAGDPAATVVADLASADHVPSDAFDCVILTQTLHFVYDVRSAMRTLHRILRPGGTLLATAPGISQTTDDSWRESWYWGFTVPSMRRLALECFPADGVEVESHGNVLAAVAFLHGLAREELRPAELAAADRDFPVVVTLRARKPPA